MEAEHRALHRDCSLHTVVADGRTARAVGRQGLLIASECLTPQGGWSLPNIYLIGVA